MSDVLVPISVCVVLPVAIVLIASLTKMNADNKRSQTLIKAIETSGSVDAGKLMEMLDRESGKERKKDSPRERLYRRLLRGCIFSLCGLVLVIVGLVNFATGADFSSDQVTVCMLLGGMALAVGISFLVVYAVSRKNLRQQEEEETMVKEEIKVY